MRGTMISSPMSRRVDSEHQFAESELDIEFGVVNQEGDASLPSFSTDVSDEEDFSSGDEDELENSKKRKHVEGNSPKPKDQLDRRRERNRVLARKTRLRKKSFFEALQKQVAQLAVENDMLKGIVRQRMGGSKSVSSVHNAPLGSAEMLLCTNRANAILENADHSLMTAIQAAQRAYVISDPNLPDNPIIFASKGFLELSGYTLENTLGRNCRFLQGPGTDQAQVEMLKEGIKSGKDISVCMLNYRADGTPFFNQIFIAAIRDKFNVITNYVGVQVEMKSLLDPNSCIDIEDLGLNKVPKKGRPRTRELKEPKLPKIKEPKEQKKLPSVPKTSQKASQKLLSSFLSSSSSSSSSMSSDKRGGSISENSWIKEEKFPGNINLDMPSLELSTPQRDMGYDCGPVMIKEEYLDSRCYREDAMPMLSGMKRLYVSSDGSSCIIPPCYTIGLGDYMEPKTEHESRSGSISSGSELGTGTMTSCAHSREDLTALYGYVNNNNNNNNNSINNNNNNNNNNNSVNNNNNSINNNNNNNSINNNNNNNHMCVSDTGLNTSRSDIISEVSQIKPFTSTDSLQVIDDLFFMFEREGQEMEAEHFASFQFGDKMTIIRRSRGTKKCSFCT